MTGQVWPADDVAMPMTAAARAINGGLRHEVEVNGRHTIMTDEPERLGGTDLGPAPHELLPTMLGRSDRAPPDVAETCPARRALEAGFTFEEQIVVL